MKYLYIDLLRCNVLSRWVEKIIKKHVGVHSYALFVFSAHKQFGKGDNRASLSAENEPEQQ